MLFFEVPLNVFKISYYCCFVREAWSVEMYSPRIWKFAKPGDANKIEINLKIAQKIIS